MSTSSASAATIFDLVIGFPIDSPLPVARSGCAVSRRIKKSGHSIRHVQPGVKGRTKSGGTEERARRSVTKQEDGFSGAREAELFARETLDRRGIAAQRRDVPGQA